MKKMTWDDWKAQEIAKRAEYKKMGVVDFSEARAKKMWNDPNKSDLAQPAAKFEFDEELKELVFCGYVNQVEH